MAIPNTTGVTVKNPDLEAQNATYRAIHIVDGYCLQTHLEAIWNWKVLVEEMIAQKAPSTSTPVAPSVAESKLSRQLFQRNYLTQPNFSAK